MDCAIVRVKVQGGALMRSEGGHVLSRSRASASSCTKEPVACAVGDHVVPPSKADLCKVSTVAEEMPCAKLKVERKRVRARRLHPVAAARDGRHKRERCVIGSRNVHLTFEGDKACTFAGSYEDLILPLLSQLVCCSYVPSDSIP
eukprot:5159381-Amphidinium_carterae.2